MTKVINEQPDEPVIYLIRALQRRATRMGLSLVSNVPLILLVFTHCIVGASSITGCFEYYGLQRKARIRPQKKYGFTTEQNGCGWMRGGGHHLKKS